MKFDVLTIPYNVNLRQQLTFEGSGVLHNRDNSMRFLLEGRTDEVSAADPDAVVGSWSKSGP